MSTATPRPYEKFEGQEHFYGGSKRAFYNRYMRAAQFLELATAKLLQLLTDCNENSWYIRLEVIDPESWMHRVEIGERWRADLRKLRGIVHHPSVTSPELLSSLRQRPKMKLGALPPTERHLLQIPGALFRHLSQPEPPSTIIIKNVPFLVEHRPASYEWPYPTEQYVPGSLDTFLPPMHPPESPCSYITRVLAPCAPPLRLGDSSDEAVHRALGSALVALGDWDGVPPPASPAPQVEDPWIFRRPPPSPAPKVDDAWTFRRPLDPAPPSSLVYFAPPLPMPSPAPPADHQEDPDVMLSPCASPVAEFPVPLPDPAAQTPEASAEPEKSDVAPGARAAEPALPDAATTSEQPKPAAEPARAPAASRKRPAPRGTEPPPTKRPCGQAEPAPPETQPRPVAARPLIIAGMKIDPGLQLPKSERWRLLLPATCKQRIQLRI